MRNHRKPAANCTIWAERNRFPQVDQVDQVDEVDRVDEMDYMDQMDKPPVASRVRFFLDLIIPSSHHPIIPSFRLPVLPSSCLLVFLSSSHPSPACPKPPTCVIRPTSRFSDGSRGVLAGVQSGRLCPFSAPHAPQPVARQSVTSQANRSWHGGRVESMGPNSTCSTWGERNIRGAPCGAA